MTRTLALFVSLLSLARPNMSRRQTCDMVRIRLARFSDLSAITEIYNQAILKTTATFDTAPKTEEEQLEWFKSHDSRHPIFVADLDGIVIGWTSLSKWSDRCAYADTAEVSTYVKEGFQGKGIGRRLKEVIDAEARRLGLHTVIARITEGNEASIHLNEAFGFQHIGVMKEVGYKFGRWLDVYMMQKVYSEAKSGDKQVEHPPTKQPSSDTPQSQTETT
jgi:L-amino acid N-acyltransferase YncA